MKKQILSNVLAATLLVIAAVASAYAGQAVTLRAKIPFAFTIGEVSLPAGDYTFYYDAATTMIKTESAHFNECVFLTHPGTSARDDGKVKIIFHQYGDQYFLSEVFNGLERAGHKLWTSKLEKDRMGAAAQAAAQNSPQSDVVVFGTR
jgi:hypothetical protein